MAHWSYDIYAYSSRTIPLEKLLHGSLCRLLCRVLPWHQKNLFCNGMPAERELYKGGTNDARYVRVRTAVIDKNSYDPKHTHNWVCQRTSFSWWSLNHWQWCCVLSNHVCVSSSWLLFHLCTILLMIHSEQSITSSNKFQTMKLFCPDFLRSPPSSIAGVGSARMCVGIKCLFKTIVS